MKGEEPSACLVYSFVYEVGRKCSALVNRIGVFKRIMYLRIRHAAGVEPNVNQVSLALHRFAGLAAKYDIVYIRTVEVYFIVVLLRIVSWHKAIVLQRV